MWAPRSWEAVSALIGSATETSALDFKRELSKNTEIAKDVSAMTLDGGVIVYGVDEDPITGIASAIVKLDLRKVEEKIAQVVGSSISPRPEVEAVLVVENDSDVEGVVVLVVSPSALAPHMANGRFPARRGTVTEYMTEAEVARLYERRFALTTADTRPLGALLEEDFVAPPALGSDGNRLGMVGGVGYLRLMVTPIAPVGQHPAHPWLHAALQAAHHRTVISLIPRLKWTAKPQELDRLSAWQPLGAVGWSSGAGQGADGGLGSTSAGATLTYPARQSFQATWPLEVAADGNAYRSAYEQDVGTALVVFLAFAGQILAEYQALGPLRCAIQLDGFQGAVSWKTTRGRAGVATAGLRTAVDFAGETLTDLRELLETPEAVARRLLDRWLVAFFEWGGYWDDIIEPSRR